MRIDRNKMAALVAAGAVWALGAGVLLLLALPYLALALLYVAAISALLADHRTSTTRGLSAGWLVAAGALALLMVDASGSVGFGIVIGCVLASVFFVGWMATAFFLLLWLEPARRVVPVETDPQGSDGEQHVR